MWILNWAYLLQRAGRLPVLQPPLIISQHIDDAHLKVKFVAAYFEPQVALTAFRLVVDTLEKLMAHPTPSPINGVQLAARPVKDLYQQLRRHQVRGINLDRMLRSAVEHRVPFTHLGMHTYLIGQGVHSRWLQSSFTDATSHLGATFARNKLAAGALLGAMGLPVARQHRVGSQSEAVNAAGTLGYPVVVKAADLDGGVGVHAGLHTPEQVAQCYTEARSHPANVLVESFQSGADYRLTVIHGQVVKAIQRIPGGVTGNGIHTVSELLQQELQDGHHQRRMRERGKVMLSLDAEALVLLAEEELTPESIVPDGVFLALRRRANVSTGSTTHPIDLAQIHPDNRQLAIRAAAALRLDVAGVDLILPSIHQSWFETGGIVCEVNGQPQFGENNAPGLYLQFFQTLLKGDGRIPIAVVASALPVHKEQINRWRAVFAQDSPGDALVAGGLLYISGKPMSPQRKSNHEQTRAALASQEITRLLAVLSLDELAAHGMPVQEANTLVLLHPEALTPSSAALLQEVRSAVAPHVIGTFHLSDDADGTSWLQLLASSGLEVHQNLQ